MLPLSSIDIAEAGKLHYAPEIINGISTNLPPLATPNAGITGNYALAG